MIETQLTIINKLGLHARAAAKLSSTAASFGSDIQLGVEGKFVDCKSVMSLMLLAAAQGREITFIIEGKDEELANETLCALVNDYFGEGE